MINYNSLSTCWSWCDVWWSM